MTENQDVPRLIVLEGCLNFRDLGGYTGEGGRKIRYGRIFRSDDLSKLSPGDMVRVGELGISTVLDLRSADELARAPNPLRGRPGFAYYHIPLLDGINSETDGPVRIESLPELYKSLVISAGKQIAGVFQVLREQKGGTVFHCAAGKDRTGLIAALILGLCGVAEEDIIADYALTYEKMRPFFDTMTQKAREAGIPVPEELLRSDPAFMRELLDFLNRTYSGAEAYLLGLGLTLRDMGDFKNRLLEKR
ncbi:MAG: tyrosine-protein phosphatase [Treponema sp.]|jgi:protein-tyrosine phosphatase|nr:tyrosine-protein phosphatase [Treponema sp.]